MAVPDRREQRAGAPRAATWVAVVLVVALGVFPFAATGLMAPPYAYLAVYLMWLGAILAAWRWRPTPSWLVVLVPVGALAAWFAILTFGDLAFGWTA